MGHLLELDGVTAGYGRVEVIHDVELVVPSGSIVALLGANGAGKTTTLRTIAGLLQPRRGSIHFDGQRVDGRPPHEVAERGLVLIPEGRGIFPNLDVRDNLRVNLHSGGQRAGGNGSGADTRMQRVLEHFPRLAERLDQRAGTLSGGEQQMLALSRAFLAEPKLLMVDEISMGLAPTIVQRLFSDLMLLKEQGVALLLVEQYVTFALDMADICYVMSHGRIDFVGEPDELRRSSVLSSSYLGT